MGRGRFAPGVRGRASGESEHRYKGSTRSQKVERRALRILEIWADHPALRPAELKERIQREFECGIGSAADALARAYEIYEEKRDDETLVSRVAEQYLMISEDARRAGKFSAATRALDSLRAHLGLGQPDRVEVTLGAGMVSRDDELAEWSDDELKLLARLERADRAIAERTSGTPAPDKLPS
jgi:hypothetical protein